MLSLFLDSIFADERSLQFQESIFNHCSSVCAINKGALLAWYSGSGECLDDQSVYLKFIDKNNSLKSVKIGHGTGNPVVWCFDDKEATLLYSKFENMKVSRITDRWKHCSLWIQRVNVANGIQLLGEAIEIARTSLLARCKPVIFNNKLILPLYNEVKATCVIGELVNDTLSVINEFGNGIIQPTLWIENNKLHLLSRNFGNHHVYAQYSSSNDGVTWSDPIDTDIRNNNSSLHAITYNNSNYLIWNDTMGKYRRLLSLGELMLVNDSVTVDRISTISEDNGSYPSAAIVNNRLVFTYTRFGKIEYHEWNRKALADRKRRRNIVK